ASRQLPCRTIKQMADPEQLNNFIRPNVLPCTLLQSAAVSITQVSSNREMRKQAGLLENVTNRTLVWLKRFSSHIVLPHLTTDHETTRQAIEACHTTEDSCLATSRRPKQRGNPAHRGIEGHVKLEIAQYPNVPSADGRFGLIHVPGRAMCLPRIII